MNTGDRVELHPAMDRWMMGDRYGTVVRIIPSRKGEDRVSILMDRSGKTIRTLISNVTVL